MGAKMPSPGLSSTLLNRVKLSKVARSAAMTKLLSRRKKEVYDRWVIPRGTGW
jgi:hypothetical protein